MPPVSAYEQLNDLRRYEFCTRFRSFGHAPARNSDVPGRTAILFYLQPLSLAALQAAGAFATGASLLAVARNYCLS
jgi:hypothetical protein